MLVSARVTPFTASRAASMANSRSRFFSMAMLNGSILQGEAQSAWALGSGTRYSSCDFTLDDARAISTALAAQPSTPSRDRSSVAAKPNPPRSEEHTSELQSPCNIVCRLLLETKKHGSKEQWNQYRTTANSLFLGGFDRDIMEVWRFFFFFFLIMGRPPISPLFPYTALFR